MMRVNNVTTTGHMMSSDSSLVQIAGMGLVTPFAWGREASWQQVLLNKSATRPLTLELSNNRSDKLTEMLTVGAALPAETNPLPGDNSSRSQRALLWSIDEALQDFNISLNNFAGERVGCVIGSSKGDWEFLRPFPGANQHKADFTHGWPHGPGSIVARKYNIRGPLLAPVAACATGLLAITRGVELIEYGTCDVVIVGSVDCSIEPVYVSSFRRLGVLNEDFVFPGSSLKPFDRRRKGFVMGEGAGALILVNKNLADAQSTNYGLWQAHHQLAEVNDTVRIPADSPTIPKVLELTLEKARLSVQEIDYINLHGTGTSGNDLAESVAVHKVFAENRHFLCSSFKGGLGHLLGAAGMVETALSLLALRDNAIPSTTNCLEQDPSIKIPIARELTYKQIKHIMKLSAGFGGHVVAGIVSKT